MKYPRRSAFFAGIASLALLIPAAPANAVPLERSAAVAQAQLASTSERFSDLSYSDELEVRRFFDMFGVAAEDQDRLIAEFEAGGMWESMSSTSRPSRETRREINGVAWRLSTYADGSLKAEGIGDGPVAGGASTFGVDSCGYKAGSSGNFSQCHIYYWVGIVQLGFYANFTISKTGYDKITSAWGGTLFAGGACGQSVPEARIVKGAESATGKAVAGLTAQATMCATGITVNFPSYLHVGGNQATHIYS